MFYGSKGLSLETIYEDLSSKESMSKLSETATPSQGEGLVVQRRNHEKKKNTSRSCSKSHHLDKTCNYCKKHGHIKIECYKLQNKMKREATSSNQPSTSDQPIANATHHSGEILAIPDSEPKSSREWILDSACSFHVCYNHEVFCSFSSSANGVVLMGNNSPSNIRGIKNVTFEMFDGKIRTLSNVRYLISLSMLESQGYRFIGEDGVLKVCKGSLVIIKGHKKTENMYFLEGSIVNSNADVVK